MDYNLITQRQQEIYDFIANANVTTIQEISDALKFSPSTIRRDLKVLEKEKRIQSFHGGVSVNTGYGSFIERTSKNSEVKKKIAEAAVELVEDNDFIYVGGGSTPFEFAAMLGRRFDLSGVTIVCSAMNIARCFVANKQFKIIVPGGELEAEDESMASKMTIDMLSRYNFTKAFVGSQAINAKNGYSIPRLNLSELKSMIVENSKELILLCDHTKIGKVSAYKVCGIDGVHTLITDFFAENEEELQKIADHGVKVIRV